MRVDSGGGKENISKDVAPRETYDVKHCIVRREEKLRLTECGSEPACLLPYHIIMYLWVSLSHRVRKGGDRDCISMFRPFIMQVPSPKKQSEGVNMDIH